MDIRLYSFDELDIVQISCLPRDESFHLFAEKSKYLRGAVFTIFQHSFELSSAAYDFYAVTPFNSGQIVSLRNHLMANQSRIAAIAGASDMEKLALKQLYGIDFINFLKDQELDWRVSWEKIQADLLKLGEELIEMVDKCIDEDLVLWIKGI
jgi:hypothetical protein